MKAILYPSRACGCIEAPPSKSMAHRALICGAFSSKSTIKNVSWSEDIMATCSCLGLLGAEVNIDGDAAVIGGLNIESIKDGTVIDCNESGSTLRFLIPICLVSGKEIYIKGSPRLMERPLNVYEDLSRENGLLFECKNEMIHLCGPLSSGNYRVRGDVSSQFISGLLFAFTLLKNESSLEVTGNFESESYVNLTVSMLDYFGVNVRREGNVFYVNGSDCYKPTDYTVEGDCSNAAFLDAFNYVGSHVCVKGIDTSTLQGDRVYKDIFLGLANGKREFDLSDCPDLAPIAFAAAAVNKGALFTGTARLKLKESDRAMAMASELSKMGIELVIKDNSVEVLPGKLHYPTAPISTHNDHRIVMAMAVLCSITGGEIDGVQAVNKSYPKFFEDILSLGIDVRLCN